MEKRPTIARAGLALCDKVGLFRRDNRGAIALVFGLALVPVIALGGAAVDYSRASLVKAKIQSASDAAALALSKGAVHLTEAQYQAMARSVFDVHFVAGHGERLTSLNVTRGDRYFNVQATVQVDNLFMNLKGQSHQSVTTESQAIWGTKKLEIALVLDNTGSMSSSSKMLHLKRALCGSDNCDNSDPTSGFLRIMRDAAVEADQIRIAMVPFDTTVRLPLSDQQAVLNGNPIVGTMSAPGSQGYCTEAGATNEAHRIRLLNNTTAIVRFAMRDKDTVFNNRDSANMPVQPGCGVHTSRGTPRLTPATFRDWKGCVWDRDQTGSRDTNPYNVLVDQIETLYPAVNCRSNGLARMLPLTDVRSKMPELLTAMQSMQPAGNTNLTIGVTWGANMLTPNLPLSTSVRGTVDQPIERFMILLTDGDNTENRETGGRGAIDQRSRAACDAAKAADRETRLTIYSIRVIDGNQQLLRDCASSPANYFEVANAEQLTPVFEEIARRIAGIRLTQ